jgi:hypothetical protein
MFVGFGLPEEWKAFENSHPVFVQKIPPLFQTIHKVFARVIKSSAPDVDRLVFHLGMLCVEDFKEILLLCTNGFGIGGQKIMRGLYEKAVTADYLSAHPGEAIKFLDYFWVHTKKDINHQKNLYGKDHWDSEFEAEVLKEYDEVKDQFLEDLCRKCGTKKPMMSWTKLNVEAMAKAAKSPLADLYLTCYFVPTLQTHTTMGAIFARLNPLGESDTVFKAGPKREEAESVLQKAHFIILNMLNTQFSHFDLDIEDELMDRAKDLDEAWKWEENREDSAEP